MTDEKNTPTNETNADDLSAIKGIGPKYVEILVEAGIDTYNKLANQTEEDLERIIDEAGARRTPGVASWPTQAREMLTLEKAEETVEDVTERAASMAENTGKRIADSIRTTGDRVKSSVTKTRESVEEAGLTYDEGDTAGRMAAAIRDFVEYESRALDHAQKAMLAWIPEDVRKHGEDAVHEFISSYRALLKPVINIEKDDKQKVDIN